MLALTSMAVGLTPLKPVPYSVKKSLRFDSNVSAYLNRTFQSGGNRKTWTFSCWVKQGTIGSLDATVSQGLFGSNPNGVGASTPAAYIGLNNTLASAQNDGGFTVWSRSSSGTQMSLTSTRVFRDVGGYYHVVVAMDTTQATAANRTKVWINGEEITTWTTATYPVQNTDLQWNLAQTHTIGHMPLSTNWARYLNGYLADVVFVDGQYLTANNFGERNTETGAWVPKRYTGTYGTTGFYLPFSDGTSTTTLGHDLSGNANNWTLNNFSVAAGVNNDWLDDSPTNNFCTLNLFRTSFATISDGSLKYTVSGGLGNSAITASHAFSSGKWYWEVNVISDIPGYTQIGIAGSSVTANPPNPGYEYISSGTKRTNAGGLVAYGATYTTNDVVGVALNLDAGTLEFYKNGVSQGIAYTGISGEFMPYVGMSYGGGSSGYINFGQRAFAYTPPTGFKSLCAANLPEPTIKNGKKHFGVVIHTTDGSATQVFTGMGFKADFLWSKSRANAYSHRLFDSIRGVTKHLITDSTGAEVDDPLKLLSFDDDGFTLGSNIGVDTRVMWGWKAGGTPVANTDGTITSQVSVNPTAGFSIVTYTGNGQQDGNATVGHGLGVPPAMVIVKGRTVASEWPVWHKDLNNNDQSAYIVLNTTARWVNADTRFRNQTSSIITLSSQSPVNALNATYVAYCFAEIPGYSKFSKYVGNSLASGPFVYCGFRPAFVMIKRINVAGNRWATYDSARVKHNPVNKLLEVQSAIAEVSTTTPLDFLSNGFKVRGVDAFANASGSTYIFAAFAETPFKYSNAR